MSRSNGPSNKVSTHFRYQVRPFASQWDPIGGSNQSIGTGVSPYQGQHRPDLSLSISNGGLSTIRAIGWGPEGEQQSPWQGALCIEPNGANRSIGAKG